MLAAHLRETEAHGIVHREAYDEVPPRVEYALTEAGQRLNTALGPLGDWGGNTSWTGRRTPRSTAGHP